MATHFVQLDFTKSTNFIGLGLGGLLGFVQYAAIGGAYQCAPQITFAVESSVLVVYEAQKMSGNIYMTTDLVINVLRLIFHIYGTYAYCESIFVTLFGPLYSYQQTNGQKTVLQQVFEIMNYFLILVQIGQAVLGYLSDDAILLGLFSGQVFGTGYMYLSELTGTQFMSPYQ